MIHRRLKDVKDQLARIAGSTGMKASSEAVVSLVNRAVEELIPEGEWPGVVDRYRTTTLDGNCILPDEFVSVELVTVDKHYQPVKGRWFELVDHGPGIQDQGSVTATPGALDRGVTSVFHNVPTEGGPWHLRVRSTRAEDADLEVVVKGWDVDGRRVVNYDDDSDGVRITLPGGIQAWGASGIPFSRVEETPGGVVLPAGRKGEITLSAFNGTDDVVLAHYLPGIEVPQFRKYFIPGLTDNTEHTVVVKAARKFKPVKSDDDMLQISYIPALEVMILALRAKDNASVEEYFNYKQLAVAELAKDAKRYRGSEPQVGIRASINFGFGFPGVT